MKIMWIYHKVTCPVCSLNVILLTLSYCSTPVIIIHVVPFSICLILFNYDFLVTPSTYTHSVLLPRCKYLLWVLL